MSILNSLYGVSIFSCQFDGSFTSLRTCTLRQEHIITQWIGYIFGCWTKRSVEYRSWGHVNLVWLPSDSFSDLWMAVSYTYTSISTYHIDIFLPVNSIKWGAFSALNYNRRWYFIWISDVFMLEVPVVLSRCRQWDSRIELSWRQAFLCSKSDDVFV